MAPKIIHYNCKVAERLGSQEFRPTGKKSRPYTEDQTKVWKCQGCRATVGVEKIGKRWIVYI